MYSNPLSHTAIDQSHDFGYGSAARWLGYQAREQLHVYAFWLVAQLCKSPIREKICKAEPGIFSRWFEVASKFEPQFLRPPTATSKLYAVRLYYGSAARWLG